MAVLGSTTLTGCEYIESFLGGYIPFTTTGYMCVFNQTTPGGSWTKVTNPAYNDIALRVVTGGSGNQISGSTAFSSVLTTKSIGLSIQPASAGVTFNSASGNVSLQNKTIQNSPTPVQTTTSANLADLPLHTHQFQRFNAQQILQSTADRANSTLAAAQDSGTTGGNVQHSHTLQFTAHSHSVNSSHTHQISGSHTHEVSGPQTQENFAVLYRDVVIAEKDVKP